MTLEYLWPTLLWTVPFSRLDEGIVEPEKIDKLSTVAEEGFAKYLRSIQPKEFDADPKFAAEFEGFDGIDTGKAWMRWQKRVFSTHFRTPVDHLDWDGQPVPKIKGIPYKWEQFYKSSEYSALRKGVEWLVNNFLNDMGDKQRRKFLTYIWAEVYRENDIQMTHVHTGAYASGMVVAKFPENGKQTIVIDDVRGRTAPYGQSKRIQPRQGDVYLWPSWAPHMVTPLNVNDTAVYFGFNVYPEDGTTELDWEDDPTGDYQFTKRSKVNSNRQNSREKAGAGSSQAKAEL